MGDDGAVETTRRTDEGSMMAMPPVWRYPAGGLSLRRECSVWLKWRPWSPIRSLRLYTSRWRSVKVDFAWLKAFVGHSCPRAKINRLRLGSWSVPSDPGNCPASSGFSGLAKNRHCFSRHYQRTRQDRL